MKMIIGNHIEETITKLNRDDRIFPQRVLWFAEEGDIIVMLTEPDPDYLQYVTSLTGVDPFTLKFYVVPEGRYGGIHFDPYSLMDEEFLQRLSEDLRDVKITEILPMWPSPAVARFADALGLSDRLLGADFFSQNGVELVNNKAYFRAFATAANIPIAPGEVCQVRQDAEYAIRRLITATGAVLVKQAHNGAGAGNELVIQSPDLEIDHVGAMHVHYLGTGAEAVEDYLKQRWDWASAQGRYPVVIEVFKPRSETIYAEFYADESGVRHTQAGRLGYTSQRLVEERAPLRGVSDEVQAKLICYGERVAHLYHTIGYRGYLSADALVNEDEDLIFTEMNARIGGSLHIYDSIAGRVVKATQEPQRTVVQYHSPKHWKPVDFKGFLTALEKIGCKYDPEHRKGVLVSLPILPEVGSFVSFCIVYGTEHEEQEMYSALDAYFSE